MNNIIKLKKIELILFFIMSLQGFLVASVPNKRQIIIDEIVKKFIGLADGFDFLKSQGRIDQSFCDFLELNLSYDDEEQDANAGEVIERAMNVIEQPMQKIFLSTISSAIEEQKRLDQFDDPIFLYVMQHKNDYMNDMVCHWVNIQDDEGKALLHTAAFNDTTEVASMLIGAGAHLNLQDNHGKTPLHYAVLLADASDVATELLLAGSNINAKDNDGLTPLHYAAHRGNLQAVYFFILAGADMNIQDHHGKTAEQVAGSFEVHACFLQNRIMKNLGCTIS
ncbi:ankyrin repeat domain-containing protein [Candidatus Chromulinivorax destructor]|uniref:Uncharacterized protein n=1 Tax=Candidatus Chromulinivorax destructor TaxID=2066483 RepID=A0A345ZA31_9BACT|nr:ankyrin repeat domain-containing protein [Candidatus Chromulinivorax destructor]AXK60148.1 hypothetical protein C0J27_00080 [Candidatus Chromulinivorax destructor]